FRGVLQGWSARRRWGGPISLTLAFALTLGKWLVKIADAWDHNQISFGGTLRDLEPVLFVLLMIPVCLLSERWLPRRPPQPYAVRAIASTALLFAVFHDWPSPLPLFVLGLGLGYLAYRTQSLVASILMHAFFNSVACLVMLLA